MSDPDATSGSESSRLAKVLGWLVAIPLFVAGVITTLLGFDVTASPPRETAPNDLLDGTLAFFENESERWPQELTALLLFVVGFLALIGLVVLVRNAVSRRDPGMTLGAMAIGVGAAIGATGQLLFLGAKQVAIDPHYCDCARAAEQIISRGQTLGILDNAQRWLILGTLALSAAGLFLIWSSTRDRGPFTGSWRGLSLALAVVLIAGVIIQVVEVPILSDIFTAVGAAILTPIWAHVTARQLSASPMARVAA